MYSSEFMKFLVGRDANDYIKKETETDKKSDENKMFRYARLATVPIEVKKEI